MTNPTTPGLYHVAVIAKKDSALLPNGLTWVSNQVWEWNGFWLNEQGIKVTDPSCIKGWEKTEG